MVRIPDGARGAAAVLPMNPAPSGGGAPESARCDAPPRVLFVVPGEARGSSMVFARRQAAALVAGEGIDVHLFYLRSRTSPRALLREFRRFRAELAALSPHVVHAHFGTVTALFAALGARGIPLVITYRGSDLNPVPGNAGERLRAWLGRGLSQIAALAAAQIVCVSGPLKQRLWWRRERAVVLPSGVDPEVFYPRSREEARRRLGWEESGPVILFNAGHGARVKRLDLAQAAVARAQRRRPDLRLEILDGRLPPELVPTLMNAADCLLVTSDAEGSPSIIQEALASNLPIVSVDVGDVAARLQDIRCARIAARDAGSLAKALVELVARPVRSDGRRKLDEFCLPRVASELGRIYRRLVAESVPKKDRLRPTWSCVAAGASSRWSPGAKQVSVEKTGPAVGFPDGGSRAAAVPAGKPSARVPCEAEAVAGVSALRVLFVIPGEGRGGCMIFSRRQAAALLTQGTDVHLFHLLSRTSPALLLREFRRFRAELGAFHPHVVHAHFGTMTALFAALACGGVPLVITYQGSDLNPVPGSAAERLRAWLGRGLSQIAALAAVQIVCVSGPLKRRLWWRSERAVVLPTGVDAEVFYPQSREEARRRLGWEQSGPVILFNGGHGAPVKRLDLAQAAVARAQRRRPDLRLEILDGRLAPELVPTLMNAADCLLLTSDAEGSPTVVQEALASNLPIVSVDVGDVREWFQNVRRARVVERDPEALAEALLELVACPERSDGRRKLSQFSTQRIASELSRIYRRLAAGPTLENGELRATRPN